MFGINQVVMYTSDIHVHKSEDTRGRRLNPVLSARPTGNGVSAAARAAGTRMKETKRSQDWKG